MTEQQREAIKALEYLENESLSSDRELDGFKINEAVQTIRAALSHAEGEAVELDRYDAGVLGGTDDSPTCWWHDYIRSELDSAHDFYQQQVDGLTRPEPQRRAYTCDHQPDKETADRLGGAGAAFAAGCGGDDYEELGHYLLRTLAEEGFGVFELNTHPAPLVAGLTETAIKSSPAYRALHREKDHLLGLLKDQAPQVAVPEALTKYDGYVPPEDGSAGEYYVDGWNSCRDAILANSAPAQTVSASVPEQKTWNQAGGREDLRYTEGWNDCRAAMLAAAPAAPAGELVTRCTAGLGCDEKGYCDAAATGQGDLCDRRTMAHEQPVSDPDGLPGTPRPMSTAPRDGTMVRLLVQFTNHGVNDGFDSGPAWTIGANTYDDSGDDEWHIAGWDWQQDCFTAGEGEPLGWLPMLSAPAPDEREIAAKAIEQTTREYFSDESGPHNLHDYLLWRAKRLRAGKEGE